MKLPLSSARVALKPRAIFILIAAVVSLLTALITLALDSHPVQTLYNLEFQAAQGGWSPLQAGRAGDTWAELGDLERAAAFWEVAVQSNQADAGRIRRLADAYLTMQRWSQAVVMLNRLLTLDPRDSWAYFHLGLSEVMTNGSRAIDYLRLAAPDPAYQAVATDLVAVLERVQTDDNRLMQVGLVLASYLKWNFAEPIFSAASAYPNVQADAVVYVGLSRERQGKSGRTEIERAIQLAPDHAVVRYVQGIYLREQEDLEGSLAALQFAVAMNPVNPVYAAELGTTLQLIGNLPQAEYWLQTAVALSGNDPRFTELLTQLQQRMEFTPPG
jgi:tetratricopeptide (TPR) repeat protein